MTVSSCRGHRLSVEQRASKNLLSIPGSLVPNRLSADPTDSQLSKDSAVQTVVSPWWAPHLPRVHVCGGRLRCAREQTTLPQHETHVRLTSAGIQPGACRVVPPAVTPREWTNLSSPTANPVDLRRRPGRLMKGCGSNAAALELLGPSQTFAGFLLVGKSFLNEW